MTTTEAPTMNVATTADGDANVAALERYLADPGNRDIVGELYDGDVVLEFPQGRERLVGLANVRAMREAYPADVAFDVRRIRGGGNLGVTEARVSYDGSTPSHGVGIHEFRDGKIVHEAIYWGEAWEPPAWRAQWVERSSPRGGPETTGPNGGAPPSRGRRGGWSAPTAISDDATRAALRRHWSDPTNQDIVHEIYRDDVVLEFPQGGERLVGLANVRGMREAYPAAVTFDIRRLRGAGAFWVTELLLTYDGQKPTHAVNIMEFEDARVVHETIYFGEPWEPPAWRAQWVEPMDGEMRP